MLLSSAAFVSGFYLFLSPLSVSPTPKIQEKNNIEPSFNSRTRCSIISDFHVDLQVLINLHILKQPSSDTQIPIFLYKRLKENSEGGSNSN